MRTVSIVVPVVLTCAFSIWLRRRVKSLGSHFAGTKSEPPKDARWAGLPWAFFGSSSGFLAFVLVLIAGKPLNALLGLAFGVGFGWWVWRGLVRLRPVGVTAAE